MKGQSALWEFRKDIPNYDNFIINEQLFSTALVCLEYYPCIILLSNELEIHINHIENVYKSVNDSYTQYHIEHVQFSPNGETMSCKCDILCICSKTKE